MTLEEQADALVAQSQALEILTRQIVADLRREVGELKRVVEKQLQEAQQ